MAPGRQTSIAHSDLVKKILLACSPYGIFWANITGTFKSFDGQRIVKTGLEDSPDVIGFQFDTGLFFGFEAKTENDSLSPGQIRFLKLANSRNVKIFEIRDPQECIDVLCQSPTS